MWFSKKCFHYVTKIHLSHFLFSEKCVYLYFPNKRGRTQKILSSKLYHFNLNRKFVFSSSRRIALTFGMIIRILILWLIYSNVFGILWKMSSYWLNIIELDFSIKFQMENFRCYKYWRNREIEQLHKGIELNREKIALSRLWKD